MARSISQTFADRHLTIAKACEQLGRPSDRQGCHNTIRLLRAHGCLVLTFGHTASVAVGDLSDYIARRRKDALLKVHARALAAEQVDSHAD